VTDDAGVVWGGNGGLQGRKCSIGKKLPKGETRDEGTEKQVNRAAKISLKLVVVSRYRDVT
jgi:hypothetical protein